MSRQKQTIDAPRGSRTRPRFARIPAALEYSGIGRSVLYIKAAEYPALFKKNGRAVIVDFDVLDRVLDDLPVAKIKPLRAS